MGRGKKNELTLTENDVSSVIQRLGLVDLNTDWNDKKVFMFVDQITKELDNDKEILSRNMLLARSGVTESQWSALKEFGKTVPILHSILEAIQTELKGRIEEGGLKGRIPTNAMIFSLGAYYNVGVPDPRKDNSSITIVNGSTRERLEEIQKRVDRSKGDLPPLPPSEYEEIKKE